MNIMFIKYFIFSSKVMRVGACNSIKLKDIEANFFKILANTKQVLSQTMFSCP